ncbi:MAG: trypsin-like peptidase domain-containing protein [Tenericutes bacterium]|nr:trypsin-like peptidase domain-containing protein [Mycoplasmatota bacterium]
MKKFIIFLGLILITGTLASCTGLFETEATESLTFLTSKSSSTTTSNTINKDLILSDIYEIIYSDIYEEVKAEVIKNVSEERFDQIYAEVITDLLAEVAAGNIEITPASIIDMIYEVENSTANAVVGVSSLNINGVETSIGSGVIYKHVGDKYYIVTNNHVVEDGTSFEIVFEDGERVNALLRGVDELVDLAVLYFITDDVYPVADFGDSDAVSKGDIVLAVGNPIGYDYFGSITFGIVSGLDRYFDIDNNGINDMFVNYIQHDAAINSGNSGGALFDINGNVIGINVIKLSATEIEGMGFAIPSNLVSAICSDIEELGYSLQKPVLGINFIDIRGHAAYFEANDITIPEGINDGFVIFEVYAGSSFDGLVLAGDIIITIADIELSTAEDFVYNFSKYIVGDVISITLYRNGEYITINDIELKAQVK